MPRNQRRHKFERSEVMRLGEIVLAGILNRSSESPRACEVSPGLLFERRLKKYYSMGVFIKYYEI